MNNGVVWPQSEIKSSYTLSEVSVNIFYLPLSLYICLAIYLIDFSYYRKNRIFPQIKKNLYDLFYLLLFCCSIFNRSLCLCNNGSVKTLLLNATLKNFKRRTVNKIEHFHDCIEVGWIRSLTVLRNNYPSSDQRWVIRLDLIGLIAIKQLN